MLEVIELQVPLMEAVQSRLTDIAGARDDIDPDMFGAGPDAAAPPTDTATEPLDKVGCALDGPRPLPALLDRLASIGIDKIYGFDLAPGNGNYAVARVLCPKLEQAAEDGAVELGVSGIAALLQMAGKT